MKLVIQMEPNRKKKEVLRTAKKARTQIAIKIFKDVFLTLKEEKDLPTEREVQDCMELSYSGIDGNENSPTGSTDEDENGVTEDVFTDEVQNGEE